MSEGKKLGVFAASVVVAPFMGWVIYHALSWLWAWPLPERVADFLAMLVAIFAGIVIAGTGWLFVTDEGP